MSFREISAWISLVTVAVCFGVYFGLIATRRGQPARPRHPAPAAALRERLVVLQIGSHAVAARLAPKDARAPRDERERLIAWRAQASATTS